MAGDQNDHDMDSIAGVLKLYFRGLEHPLFPKDIFHDLIACVSKYRYRNEQIVKAVLWICLRQSFVPGLLKRNRKKSSTSGKKKIITTDLQDLLSEGVRNAVSETEGVSSRVSSWC